MQRYLTSGKLSRAKTNGQKRSTHNCVKQQQSKYVGFRKNKIQVFELLNNNFCTHPDSIQSQFTTLRKPMIVGSERKRYNTIETYKANTSKTTTHLAVTLVAYPGNLNLLASHDVQSQIQSSKNKLTLTTNDSLAIGHNMKPTARSTAYSF